MTKKGAIIVDIDGTLANCDHRRHFVDGSIGKKDWKAFYEAMIDDTLNKWCDEIIYSLGDTEHCCYDTILVSGRPEEYRNLTLEWLKKNGVDSTGYFSREMLFMRKNGDFRDDAIIKEEIYREHIEPYYNILFVIDDRKRVVDMWRRLGLVCLHCADGDF